MSFIKYIADENHYKEVLSLVEKAKRTVWIGTADIKDLYVDDKPFLALIASLLKKGVEVRLIHAKEPGTAWREDHEKHPILYDGMERVLCPRVHFKLIIIDSTIAYVGSANLTGAGMGMKSPRKRNFEAGILTDDPKMLLMNILIRFFALFLQKYPLFWKLFVNLHPKANMMMSPVFRRESEYTIRLTSLMKRARIWTRR